MAKRGTTGRVATLSPEPAVLPPSSYEHEVLPLGWSRVTIGDVCDLNPGLPQPPDDNSEVTFVPMGAVSEELGEIVSPEVRTYSEVKQGYTSFIENDVLWAKITPCMENGKSAIARQLRNGIGFGSTEFFVLRSTSAILPELLHHFMRQRWYRNEAAQAMAGAAGLARVPKAFVSSTPIALPPLAEQERIVAQLDAFEKRLRSAKVKLAEVPRLLVQARQSYLAAALCGELTADWRDEYSAKMTGAELLEQIRNRRRNWWEEAQLEAMRRAGKTPKDDTWKAGYEAPKSVSSEAVSELPETWVWASGAELMEPGAEIVYGIVQPGPKLATGVPYVRGMDIEHGRILVDQLMKTSPAIATRYKRSSLAVGDVLLGIIRATKVAVVPETLDGANITQGTARFRPASVISSAYLARALEAPVTQSWLHAHYRGIDMPGLNLADVRCVPLPLAPLEEQCEIVRRLEAAFVQLEAAASAQSQAVAEMERLQQSFLAEAFRGQIVAQDANDEPITVLLECIRSQRAVAAQLPRRKKNKSTKTKPTTMPLRDLILKTFGTNAFTFENLRSEASDRAYDALKDELFNLLRATEVGASLVMRYNDKAETMEFLLR